MRANAPAHPGAGHYHSSLAPLRDLGDQRDPCSREPPHCYSSPEIEARQVGQGVAAKLVIGSLYYLRDGEVPQALSRLGSNKRGQVLRIWTGPKLEGADDRLPLLTP